MPTTDYSEIKMAFSRSLYEPVTSASKKFVTTIIPAHDEEGRVGNTIDLLKQTNIPMNIMVINDGSKDRTAEEAIHHGAEVINLKKNMGKAYAYFVGIREGSKKGTQFLISMDADMKKISKNWVAHMVTLACLHCEPYSVGAGDTYRVVQRGVKPVMIASGFLEGEEVASANLSGIRCFNREAVEKLSRVRLSRFTYDGGKKPIIGFGLESFLNGYFRILQEKNMASYDLNRDLSNEFHAQRAYRKDNNWQQAIEFSNAEEFIKKHESYLLKRKWQAKSHVKK